MVMYAPFPADWRANTQAISHSALVYHQPDGWLLHTVKSRTIELVRLERKPFFF